MSESDNKHLPIRATAATKARIYAEWDGERIFLGEKWIKPWPPEEDKGLLFTVELEGEPMPDPPANWRDVYGECLRDELQERFPDVPIVLTNDPDEEPPPAAGG